MRLIHTTVLFLLLVLLASCSNLILKPVDYSWPLESVLKVDEKGQVTDPRYSLNINVSELLKNEFAERNEDEGIELRVIRNSSGYYFITGHSFRNIYVFESGSGELILNNQFTIPGVDSFSDPAFNQRSPFIELLIDGEKYLLNEEGVVK